MATGGNTITGRSPTLQSKASLSFSNNTSDVKNLLMANGIYDRYDMQWHKKFARFGVIDPYNAFTGAKEYIFITKPDLCLMTSSGAISPALKNSPFFTDAINRYPHVARQLQSSVSAAADGPFMNILSNTVTSTLDLPGISAGSVETAGNVMGTRIAYRSSSGSSDYDFDFNLEFEDTKFLDVYMLFKMYDEFERYKWSGLFDPRNAGSDRWTNYIINKVLYDQVSIYKFIVADDGARIIFYARITGCVPTSIPRDALNDLANTTGTQKLTIGWKGHFVRDSNPVIISHFNRLVASKKSNKADLPIYNMSTHSVDGRWASTPYIETRIMDDAKHGSSARREYYLRWKV